MREMSSLVADILQFPNDMRYTVVHRKVTILSKTYIYSLYLAYIEDILVLMNLKLPLLWNVFVTVCLEFFLLFFFYIFINCIFINSLYSVLCMHVIMPCTQESIPACIYKSTSTFLYIYLCFFIYLSLNFLLHNILSAYSLYSKHFLSNNCCKFSAHKYQ